MTTGDKVIIRNLAKKVRAEVINWINYGNNYDIDPHTMVGTCAIASYALFKVLRANGYRVTFVCGVDDNDHGGHCWVKYKDIIIDITAVQFGDYPDVLIRETKRYPILKHFPNIFINNKALEVVWDWGGQSPLIYMSTIDNLAKRLTPN